MEVESMNTTVDKTMLEAVEDCALILTRGDGAHVLKAVDCSADMFESMYGVAISDVQRARMTDTVELRIRLSGAIKGGN
jgi:hypothetical protein